MHGEHNNEDPPAQLWVKYLTVRDNVKDTDVNRRLGLTLQPICEKYVLHCGCVSRQVLTAIF
jgi:hypothetical protein